MEEIKAAISITDGMTPAFKHMNSAMEIVISNFAALERQSGKAVDATSIYTARAELMRANAAIDQMEVNFRQAAAAADGMNDEMRESESLASGLASKIGAAVAAYAGWESAKALIGMADDYTNIESRLNLMNDGLQSTVELQKMIRDSANETGSNYKDTADAVGKLGIQAGSAFKDTKEIVAFSDQLNKHMKLAGTDTAAAQGAMMQMTQAMSNGVLRGEELNSVLDGMPTVAKTIEAHFHKMGDTRGIKQIAEEGLITSDIVKTALFDAAEETNAKFASMGATFGGLWNVFSNKADEALTPVYKKLGEIAGSKAFQNFVSTAAGSIGVLGNALTVVLDGMIGFGSMIADNWAIVSPVLATAAGAIGTMLVAGIATATKSLYAMATAAWAANAPLLPWIAAGAALAGIAYLIWQHSDKLRAIWDGLKAKASEVITAVMEWWNGLGNSIPERMGAAVGQAVGFLATLPGRFAGFVAEMVTSAWDARHEIVASVADMVTGAGAAGMKLVDKAIEWGKGAYEAVKEWVGKIPSMVTDFIDGVKAGFTLKFGGEGKKVAENATGGIYRKGAFLTTFAEKSPEAAIPLDGSQRAVSLWRQAGEMLGVKPKAITLPATDNEKKTDTRTVDMMRQLAKREAISKFTTAEIKINMNNQNTISREMDIDMVVEKLTEKLHNAMSVAAEGVHI